MRRLRQSIVTNTLDAFVKDFMINWFNGLENIPKWVFDAMKEAKISLE